MIYRSANLFKAIPPASELLDLVKTKIQGKTGKVPRCLPITSGPNKVFVLLRPALCLSQVAAAADYEIHLPERPSERSTELNVSTYCMSICWIIVK
jgi:hypothetical protein